jgi:hypothetical protein
MRAIMKRRETRWNSKRKNPVASFTQSSVEPEFSPGGSKTACEVDARKARSFVQSFSAPAP